MTTASAPARWLREADRLPDGGPARPDPPDPTPLLGDWRNSNDRTWGVSRFTVTRRDGRLWLRIWADDPTGDGTREWGEAPIEELYTHGPLSSQVCAYTATFELGHARTVIQANQNHGVTVIAALTTFTDGSGRAPYLSREFFHRLG